MQGANDRAHRRAAVEVNCDVDHMPAALVAVRRRVGPATGQIEPNGGRGGDVDAGRERLSVRRRAFAGGNGGREGRALAISTGYRDLAMPHLTGLGHLGKCAGHERLDARPGIVRVRMIGTLKKLRYAPHRPRLIDGRARVVHRLSGHFFQQPFALAIRGSAGITPDHRIDRAVLAALDRRDPFGRVQVRRDHLAMLDQRAGIGLPEDHRHRIARGLAPGLQLRGAGRLVAAESQCRRGGVALAGGDEEARGPERAPLGGNAAPQVVGGDAVAREPLIDRPVEVDAFAGSVLPLEIVLDAAEDLHELRFLARRCHRDLKEQSMIGEIDRAFERDHLAYDAAGADARAGAEDAVLDHAFGAERSADVSIGAKHAVIDAPARRGFPFVVDQHILLKQFRRRRRIEPDHGVAKLAGGAEMQEFAGDFHHLKGNPVHHLPKRFAESGGDHVGLAVGCGRQGGGHVFVKIDLLGRLSVQSDCGSHTGHARAEARQRGDFARGLRIEKEQAGIDQNAVVGIGCTRLAHGVCRDLLERLANLALCAGDEDAVAERDFRRNPHGNGGDARGRRGDIAMIEQQHDIARQHEHARPQPLGKPGQREIEMIEEGGNLPVGAEQWKRREDFPQR